MTPLVLLHGFLGQPRAWDEVARCLEWGGGVEAIALPGHGPRPWIPGAGRDAEAQGAHRGRGAESFDETIDALAPRLPPRAHLAGYSMGARVALGLAARHPARVASLTLVGPHPGLTDDAERRARRAWESELARDLEARPLAAFVDAWEALPIFATQRALPEPVRARRRAERTEHVPAALAWSLRALGLGAMPPLWDAFASLAAPIHLVTGARDEKFSDIARKVLARAPACVHTVVAGVGHDVGLEAPRELASILRATLHREVARPHLH